VQLSVDLARVRVQAALYGDDWSDNCHDQNKNAYELIQHDQQPNPGDLNGIGLARNLQLAHTLRLEAGPASTVTDTIGRCTSRQSEVTVHNSDVSTGQARDVVQASAHVSLDHRLSRSLK
jgi:hypothetical protein